jgi:hypothetical protein
MINDTEESSRLWPSGFPGYPLDAGTLRKITEN